MLGIHKDKMAGGAYAFGIVLAFAQIACAETPTGTDANVVATPSAAAQPAAEKWAFYGQFTNVTQWHSRFRSPYSGGNSLDANGRMEETTDLTLYAGLRLGRHTELWLNPEVDQGFGLSNTLGLAGFSSGEAYKIGANIPYLRLPRAFVRHVIPLGGAAEEIDAGANQMAGTKAHDNVTLTVGKFSVVDIFDSNSYAHDPRMDFLNWSVIDAGAFDYAADAWGFTYGAAAEWTKDRWTLRGGVFQLSKIPNGKVTGIDFSQYMLVGELEQRYQWGEHPGKFKLLSFVNRGRMGSYHDALQLARQNAETPEVARVRRVASRPGVAINVEQKLAADIGVFARASINDGSKEAYEFTEINKSVLAGVSMQGDRWGRHDDTAGLAVVASGLSNAARAYFAAGGMGILIGDGRLNYGPEKILETYYSLRLAPQVALSLNYQYVSNPAYNRDRGPVSIVGIRLHSEY